MRLALEPVKGTGFQFTSASRGVSFYSPQLASGKVQSSVVSSGFLPVRGNRLETTPFGAALTTQIALDCNHHQSCIVLPPQEWSRANSYSHSRYQQTDGIYRNPCYGQLNASAQCSRKMECVNCGCINSGAWTYDGVGNYLCGYCQYRKNRLFQLAVSTPVSNISNIPSIATRDCIVQPVKRPKRILPHPSSRSGTICSNCKTSQTSLWRRAPEGDVVCNACGLYRKMHGRQRPLTMRRDSIQTRKRRCAKKHLSSSNHLQQQQQQRHEPRLESIDGQAHSSIIKRQYLAASNPYAYFPSRTVKTEPYVMPGKVPHFDPGRNVCQFDKSWNNIPAKVPQPFQQAVISPTPHSDFKHFSYSSVKFNSTSWNASAISTQL